jgi:hypothetical protein
MRGEGNMKDTGLFDINKQSIKEGDFVSLGDRMTADDSLGFLPNGWTFDRDKDVYQVYFNANIQKYSLHLGVLPTTRYNVKYLNHALSILHSGDAEIMPNWAGEPLTAKQLPKCENCNGTGLQFYQELSGSKTAQEMTRLLHLYQIACCKCEGVGEI